MVLSSHHAEVVFRVLVPILHLDHVTAELRFASAYEILLVALPCVAWVQRATLSLRTRNLIHVVCPSLTRAARLSTGSSLQAAA
jgi:hypothetical protein